MMKHFFFLFLFTATLRYADAQNAANTATAPLSMGYDRFMNDLTLYRQGAPAVRDVQRNGSDTSLCHFLLAFEVHDGNGANLQKSSTTGESFCNIQPMTSGSYWNDNYQLVGDRYIVGRGSARTNSINNRSQYFIRSDLYAAALRYDTLVRNFNFFLGNVETLKAQENKLTQHATDKSWSCDQFVLSWKVETKNNQSTVYEGGGQSYCDDMKHYAPDEARALQNTMYMQYTTEYVSDRYVVVRGELPTNSVNTVTYYYSHK